MLSAILNRLISIFLISSVFLIFSQETGYGAVSPGNSNPEIIVQGPADNIELVTFSKDGRFIATSSDNILNIWQLSDFKLLRTLTTPCPVVSLVFSPDGNMLATATTGWESDEEGGPSSPEILIWSVNDGVVIKRYQSYGGSILFAQGGKVIVERINGKEINIRDVATTKIIRNIKLKDDKEGFTGNISLNQSENLLVSAVRLYNRDQKTFNKNLVVVWDFQTGKLVRQFEGHNPPAEVQYSRPRHSGWLFENKITFVTFTPDNNVISSSSDKTTRLWSLKDGQQLKIFKDDPYFFDMRDWIMNTFWVSFDPNSGLLAVLEKDQSINIRNVHNGQIIKTIQNVQKGQLINTRMCSGGVSQIAFSPDGKYLVGGSPLKIWALPDGNQIGSLGFTDSESNPPLTKITYGCETFSNSNLNSLAFYPDGKLLCSASWNGISRFWNLSTGKLESAYGHHRRLKEIGIETDRWRIFWTPSHKESRIDTTWWVSARYVASPVFNRDRDILVARDNKNPDKINVLSILNGRLTKSLEHKVEVPTVLSFNNDGTILSSSTKRILLPKTNTPEIKLWSMPDGSPIRTFNKELSNCLSAIPVGKLLICYYTDNSIKFWRISDGSLEKTISKQIPSKPMDGHLYSNHDGTILAVVSESETKEYVRHNRIDLWHLPDGKYLKRIDITDKGDKTDSVPIHTIDSVYISPDSSFMCIIGYNDEEEGQQRLLLYRIADGKLLKNFRGHFSCPFFTPDGKLFLANFTDESNISVFRLSDGKLIQTIPENGDITISKDGRFMGVRNRDTNADELWLWRAEASKERFEKILSMRYQNDGEYVMYTPDGYYDRSPEGTSQIYWTFPNGRFPESFSFEQLESVYRRPDIIKARISGDLNAGKPAPPATRPPYVEMTEHRELKETEGNTYPLKLTASALDEVKTLRIFVNGKSTMDIPIGAKEKELSLDVPLSPGMNRITAIAYNQKGFSSNTKYMDVLCKRTDLPKPNLYVIGIGVSEYAMLPKEWQLSSAHKDAKSIIKAFKSQEGNIFGRVETRLLTNAEASVEAITDALKGLESVKENDLAVVFLAGHGIMSKDEVFYFLTPSGDLEKPEKGGISWTLLGDALNKVKGRVLVLLDACHSGNISTQVIVPNDELAQKLRSEGKSGIMVFSASKGRQSALEDVEGGFGVFAHAITQSLGPESKQADTNGNGFVEFMELVDYVRKKVDKETEGDQTPWLSRKELFGDFAIASVLK